MPATLQTKPNSPASETEVERLLTGIASGDKDALSRLYALCRTAVYGFALSIVKEKPDAEDVLQDVFVKIWQSAPNYHPQGKPMAWILTITKNLATGILRGRSKTSELPEELPAAGGSEHSDNKIVLSAAMSVLAEDERQIVMLHAVSGMKHREIAQVMTLPLSTVLSKYNRAKKKLQTSIEGGEAL